MVFLTFELAIYALTFVVILALILKRSFVPKRRSPPSPFRWPIIGNVNILLSKEPHKKFLELTRRHGPVFTIAVGPVGVLCLTKYHTIKEALVKQGDIFSGRPRLHALGLSERGYNGIVMVEGEGWKVHRRFALQTLKEFGVGRPLIEDKILLQTDHLRHMLKENADSERSFNLAPLLELCMSNILADLVFGRTFERDDEEFQHFLSAVDESFRLAVSFGSGLWETYPTLTRIPLIRKWIGYEDLCKVDRVISAFIRKQMRECEQRWDGCGGEQEVHDFTTAFLREMRKRESDSGTRDPYFNDRQLLGVIHDLLAAGIETTVVSLNWVFLYLCLFPDVQTKVQREIDCVIGKNRPASMTDKPVMPYTQAVLCECLRYANIIPFNLVHKVQKDTQFGGYDVPADTWVLAQISAVLWDPDVFPNPECFKPERFLDENGRAKNVEEFIPFSIGKRSCLGENLAKAGLFLITTQVLQMYTFRFPPGQSTPSVEGVMGLTKKPNPYQCVISTR